MDQKYTKISTSGLVARSPEGHAARGMPIKGNEDVWVEIQANTFRNWVNEHLPAHLRVQDLSQDLSTGVRLCALVEALRGRPLKPATWNRKPTNQHHYIENVTTALHAIEQDGVKLVNIGNVDIVNGNLKLILGLIWSLIVHYQIGRSKFPPRKLMLSWLQAALPECRVTNLTTDWNSGVLLAALIDHCRPGAFPHWRTLDKGEHIENCREAMETAQHHLGIPAVLEPDYLASPWLDELSGMTYLSYFMKPDAVGYQSTLRWVNSRLKRPIRNFTTDWNDGRVICELIRSLGGNASDPEKLRTDPIYWEPNWREAHAVGRKLGVEPVLSAKDMADVNVEHLGVMAYAAQYQWVPERPAIHDMIRVHLNSTYGRLGEAIQYHVELLDPNLSWSRVSVEVHAPDNKVYADLKIRPGRGTGNFHAHKIGMHEIVVLYDGDRVSDGHFVRVLPRFVETRAPGIAPCAIGSLVQVIVNATGAPRRQDILVTAYSPSGRPLDCPLTLLDGTNSATFQPDEAGEWRIEITYQGKQIQGGPYTCAVFDPDGIRVHGLEGALPMIPHVVDVDCRAVGVAGELLADVVRDKRSVHSRIEKIDNFFYRVHFTPMDGGKHRLYVYFNGYDVKGSPFMMRIGSQKHNHKPATNNVPLYQYRSGLVGGGVGSGNGIANDGLLNSTNSSSTKYTSSSSFQERLRHNSSSSSPSNYSTTTTTTTTTTPTSPTNHYTSRIVDSSPEYGSTARPASSLSGRLNGMRVSDAPRSPTFNRSEMTSSSSSYTTVYESTNTKKTYHTKSTDEKSIYSRVESPYARFEDYRQRNGNTATDSPPASKRDTNNTYSSTYTTQYRDERRFNGYEPDGTTSSSMKVDAMREEGVVGQPVDFESKFNNVHSS